MSHPLFATPPAGAQSRERRLKLVASKTYAAGGAPTTRTASDMAILYPKRSKAPKPDSGASAPSEGASGATSLWIWRSSTAGASAFESAFGARRCASKT